MSSDMKQYLNPPPPRRAPLKSGDAVTTSKAAPSRSASGRPVPAKTGAVVASGPKSTNPRRGGTTPDDHASESLKRLNTTSSSSSDPPARYPPADTPSSNPFVHQYGRRFLRDQSLRYPLPIDLVELHRQAIRTLMFMRVHSGPFCAPLLERPPPKKVLEMGCGNALWSSICSDYFTRNGAPGVSFTGLDIAPLAPDLEEQGVNWKFVKWDMRKSPMPFPDEEFDYIFIKDCGFCLTSANLQSTAIIEPTRMLKKGGTLELWTGDYTFRTLLPHPAIPANASDQEIEQVEESGTYLTSPSTPFAKTENRYLADYNLWVTQALEKRNFTAAPCAIAAWAFTSNPDMFYGCGSRRVAIPFGELRWEKEGQSAVNQSASAGANEKGRTASAGGGAAEKKPSREAKALTPSQAAIRRTALTTSIHFIEALELILKEESGKRQDEWERWWEGLTVDLLAEGRLFSGECMEIGAWWGRKS